MMSISAAAPLRELLLLMFPLRLICPHQTVKAFLPQMKANNHGHIITIASVLGLYATAYVEVRFDTS